MNLVREVRRKPRKTVSSSNGAKMAVTVNRLAYVGTFRLMILATMSTVPLPPAVSGCKTHANQINSSHSNSP